MSIRLPPPDPSEPSGKPPDAGSLRPPTVVFLKGSPSRAQDRLCDALLAYRPGLLFVCVPG